MRQYVQKLQGQFDVAVHKRKADAELVLVRFSIDKELASPIDRSRLELLDRFEMTVNVTDFHIRPPVSEFGRPAALGFLQGKAMELGGISYRQPVSWLDDADAPDAQTPPKDADQEPPG